LGDLLLATTIEEGLKEKEEVNVEHHYRLKHSIHLLREGQAAYEIARTHRYKMKD
jgi:hypothetical protein